MSFTITELPADPFAAFAIWYADFLQVDTANPNAMVLATCNQQQPSARIVLLKEWDTTGFVFYTNYHSRKGQQLAGNNRAALLLYQDQCFRQIRIEGTVHTLSREESHAYYATRPPASQIGAWASRQSAPLADRAQLVQRVETYQHRFAGQPIPLPDFWGGYRLEPVTMEFWHGEHARLHQRRQYTRTPAGWSSTLLYP